MRKDKIGQEITVGSYVVYGSPLGRCAGLRVGIVKSIKEKEDYRWPENKYIFTVRGIDMEWNYKDIDNFSETNDRISLNKKDGHLNFSTRIIVLQENQLPPYLVKLLQSAL